MSKQSLPLLLATLTMAAVSVATASPAQAYAPPAPFRTNVAFVSNMYTQTLGRTADSEGLRYYAGGITDGRFTAGEAFTSLVRSAEGRQQTSRSANGTCFYYVLGKSGYQTATGFDWVDDAVRAGYRCALGRFPDSAGAAYWEDRVIAAAGRPYEAHIGIAALMQGLGGSAEFLNGHRSFVQAAYEDLLERSPVQNREPASIDEVDYWTGRLNSGSMSQQAVAQFFISTQEFRDVKADNV